MMGLFFKPLITHTYYGKIFVHPNATCRDFRAEYFCFSVSPEKEKLFSVTSVPQW
jgi:hypothetical protein